MKKDGKCKASRKKIMEQLIKCYLFLLFLPLTKIIEEKETMQQLQKYTVFCHVFQLIKYIHRVHYLLI